MTSKRVKLGRGLNALLEQNQLLSTNPAHVAATVQMLPIEQLYQGMYQPRGQFNEASLQELAESIRSQGIIQPLVVREQGEKYEILAGERRWRAAQLAGLTEVPVIIRLMDDKSALALALIENIQREDLSAIEQARALARLAEEFSLTHQQIAELIGKSRATVSNLLRLLSLPDLIVAYLKEGQIEMGHARALLSLEPSLQASVAKQVVAQALTVRATERLVQRLQHEKKSVAPLSLSSEELQQLQARLRTSLKRVVKIKPSAGERGKVTLFYKNLTDLHTLTQLLTGAAEPVE